MLFQLWLHSIAYSTYVHESIARKWMHHITSYNNCCTGNQKLLVLVLLKSVFLSLNWLFIRKYSKLHYPVTNYKIISYRTWEHEQCQIFQQFFQQQLNGTEDESKPKKIVNQKGIYFLPKSLLLSVINNTALCGFIIQTSLNYETTKSYFWKLSSLCYACTNKQNNCRIAFLHLFTTSTD